MAQWLDPETDDREVLGLIPLAPLGNFGKFLYHTTPVSFGSDNKSHWSFLSHKVGKYATSRGLHILPGQ